jgi:hypothetical protein
VRERTLTRSISFHKKSNGLTESQRENFISKTVKLETKIDERSTGHYSFRIDSTRSYRGASSPLSIKRNSCIMAQSTTLMLQQQRHGKDSFFGNDLSKKGIRDPCDF